MSKSNGSTIADIEVAMRTIRREFAAALEAQAERRNEFVRAVDKAFRK